MNPPNFRYFDKYRAVPDRSIRECCVKGSARSQLLFSTNRQLDKPFCAKSFKGGEMKRLLVLCLFFSSYVGAAVQITRVELREDPYEVHQFEVLDYKCL
jgi:hypothetical protein